MPKISLNDANVRNFQPPSKGTEDYWCDKLPGFGVRVSQGGAKTFVLKLDNSRRAIGRYPIISLTEARTEARRLLAERTLGKHRPQYILYEDAVEQFLEEKRKNRRPATVEGYRFYLEGAFKGRLCHITHGQVSDKLKKVKTTGTHNHALWAYRAFFNWCGKRRLLTDNPITGISNRSTQSRTRVLTDAELLLIWRACSGEFAEYTNKASQQSSRAAFKTLPTNFAKIVQLLILTGQRRGEIAALRAEYFSWQPTAPTTVAPCAIQNQPSGASSSFSFNLCTLPGTLTKNKREHTFPIGALTAELTTKLLDPTASKSSGLLFPARGSSSRPFNGWSKSKAILDEICGVKNWTLHDLRRTFATRLAELGVPPHVIERLLNHITGQISGVAAIYNRAKYLEEMRQAIGAWEAYLNRLISSR